MPDLRDDQILWADFDYDGLSDRQDLIDELGIAELVTSLDPESSPSLVHNDGVLHVSIKALREEDHEPRTVHALVGPNWIVTVHDSDLEVVEKFNEPLVGETRIGDLDGPKFLSLVLDWQLTGYLKAVTSLHDRIDELDEKLLQISPSEETLLQRLLELRREVRRLRDLLASHREVLGLLSHPESDVVIGYDAADDYLRLEARLQQALDEVATGREMIVGSFDIYMTRTAQATNDVMRRLTIVSVLLLPAVVIAGVMGMNFRVGFFEMTWLFWVVIGVMAILGGVTLVIAKRRGWY
jgi:Mg2+ and Co2+ transporter CorA